MSYETKQYENRYNCNNQVEVEEEYENNNENNRNTTNNIEMNSVDSWRLRTLYTDTKYVCAAAKTRDEVLSCDKLFAYQNASQTHPSCLPVIVKDITQPYTYYTMKSSYGNAQDNNYYVNFDDHVSGLATATTPSNYHYYNNNAFDPEAKSSVTFENSGCVKTYLCSLLGCFVCCLFHLKPY